MAAFLFLKGRYVVIDAKNIRSILDAACPTSASVASILGRAGRGKGLSIEDAALLLCVTDPAVIETICRKAAEVKERVFGSRIVLFAPLYLSNHCTNGCLYCGFRSSNKGVERKALTVDEVVREAGALADMGFKRVLLVTGEDPRWGLDYIVSCVRALYEKTAMRIVHVNAPPMDTAGLKALKAAGTGVYQAFQETYHRQTYELMHPSGRKKDFDYRLEVMDRAIDAGFEDVGIGPLFGLYDHRFDTLCSIAHSMHLYEKYATHAHTISIPRLRPASEFAIKEVPYPVSDLELKKIVAIIRLTIPSAGVVASTRESAPLRAELIRCGATQLSAGSRTNPGGYSQSEGSLEQFSTNDHRTLSEVIRSVIDDGMLPSLCTTCYRVGRTGHNFTEKTISGGMNRLCQANALLTLKEYLQERLSGSDARAIETAIEKGLLDVKDEELKKALIEKLSEIEQGKKDLYF
ncbi:MAG: [FeFe] hydrogenase H-cluster radical SAM maturase HydG [Deltaproteobacteria bacterium]